MNSRIVLLAVASAFSVTVPLHAQDAHAGHAAGQAAGATMMCGIPGAGMHGAAGGMQHGAAAGAAAGAMQGGMGMHEMMGGYAAHPGMLLHHTADLALTPDQVKKIETLQQTAQQDCEQHAKLAHEQHTAAKQALQAQSPDLAAFETSLRAAAQHMVQAHVALARRGVEALNLLTAQQRTKLQGMKHDSH